MGRTFITNRRKRNAYRLLVEMPEEERQIGRPYLM
jgi:hypothetical protein